MTTAFRSTRKAGLTRTAGHLKQAYGRGCLGKRNRDRCSAREGAARVGTIRGSGRREPSRDRGYRAGTDSWRPCEWLGMGHRLAGQPSRMSRGFEPQKVLFAPTLFGIASRGGSLVPASAQNSVLPGSVGPIAAVQTTRDDSHRSSGPRTRTRWVANIDRAPTIVRAIWASIGSSIPKPGRTRLRTSRAAIPGTRN